jgi:hypothetical protein
MVMESWEFEMQHGHVHRQASASVALQIANSAARLCSHMSRYIIKL